MSRWVTLDALAARWHVRRSSLGRKLQVLVDTGAVEMNEDCTAVRFTWPADVVASFASLDRWSTTEG